MISNDPLPQLPGCHLDFLNNRCYNHLRHSHCFPPTLLLVFRCQTIASLYARQPPSEMSARGPVWDTAVLTIVATAGLGVAIAGAWAGSADEPSDPPCRPSKSGKLTPAIHQISTTSTLVQPPLLRPPFLTQQPSVHSRRDAPNLEQRRSRLTFHARKQGRGRRGVQDGA